MKVRGRPGRGVAASVLALALALCGGAVAEPIPRSGRYGSMAVVVRDGHVAGVFAESRGGADGMPSFSCIFLLRGTLSGARAAVTTWYPGETERITGAFTFTTEGAELALAEDHGGCPMATGSMVGKPYALLKGAPEAGSEPESWQGVGLVTARRAIFRPEPGPAPRRGSYLVENDPVAVLERREGWVRALYQGGKTPFVGWLPAADLAAAGP